MTKKEAEKILKGLEAAMKNHLMNNETKRSPVVPVVNRDENTGIVDTNLG